MHMVASACCQRAAGTALLLAVAVAVAALSAAAPALGQGCRCVPPMPCWGAVPWKHLNASVSGRLRVS